MATLLISSHGIGPRRPHNRRGQKHEAFRRAVDAAVLVDFQTRRYYQYSVDVGQARLSNRGHRAIYISQEELVLFVLPRQFAGNYFQLHTVFFFNVFF